MILQGGCQCGAIRYEIDADAIHTLYCCHCRECQRQASSAFGMSMKLARTGFRLTAGEPATWERTADSGRPNRAHFCPTCGVRIFHDSGDDSELVSLKAGSLDDTSALEPVGHIWTSRAQSWLSFAAHALLYGGQPDHYDDLAATWRKRHRPRR